MAKKKKTPITIEGIEYNYEELEQEQQVLIQHIRDLEQKIQDTQFEMDQYSVGREAFVQMLIKSLGESDENE